MILIDKTKELMYRVLRIGEEYGQADRPTKIEVGKLMTNRRRVVLKVNKKKKTYR